MVDRSAKFATKTVKQVLTDGISTLSDLQESLQMAIQLEFSTIPPYLCAQWSVKDPGNPAAQQISCVVLQEMLHMGLVCNMLTAVGRQPAIAGPGLVPAYPTLGLPGNVHPGLRVDLLPLGAAALQTFLTIEQPENPPIAMAALGTAYGTIGQFYDAISDAFVTLSPAIEASAIQVETNVGPDKIFAVKAVKDALTAIREIKEQGEGTGRSKDEGASDPRQLAHYYVFQEIQSQALPEVYNFSASPNPQDSVPFDVAFSDLLRLLQKSWTVDKSMITKAGIQMIALERIGRDLIQKGIRPEFLWSDQTAGLPPSAVSPAG